MIFLIIHRIKFIFFLVDIYAVLGTIVISKCWKFFALERVYTLSKIIIKSHSHKEGTVWKYCFKIWKPWICKNRNDKKWKTYVSSKDGKEEGKISCS